MTNKASIKYTPDCGEVTDTIYAVYQGKVIAKKEICLRNLVDVVEHGNKAIVTSNAVAKAIKDVKS